VQYDPCAGVLPREPNRYDYTATRRERPPAVERALYMILHDSTLRQADRAETLKQVLMRSRCRLRAARDLTTTSPCLQEVPEAARNRFVELMNALPDTAGTKHHLQCSPHVI
jgi:hypothetical protein